MCKKESKYRFFFPLWKKNCFSGFFTLACLVLPPPAFSKWELLLIYSQEKSLLHSTVGYFRTIGLLTGFPVAGWYRELVQNSQADRLVSDPCPPIHKMRPLEQVSPCFSRPQFRTYLPEMPCVLKILHMKCLEQELTPYKVFNRW